MTSPTSSTSNVRIFPGAVRPSGSASGELPRRRAVDDLMASSRRSLAEASIASSAGERYAAAHLSALRAAAAVVSARSQSTRRGRVRSVWALLPEVAPEFTEWAEFFAAGASKRAAAEAGAECVSHREADDLVREADAFMARVAKALGFAHTPLRVDALLRFG